MMGFSVSCKDMAFVEACLSRFGINANHQSIPVSMLITLVSQRSRVKSATRSPILAEKAGYLMQKDD
jgi:hypothetical protein